MRSNIYIKRIPKNYLKDKKILVTGSSGFIGSNLTRYLIKKDYDVAIILRNDSNLWRLKGLLNKVHIIHLDLLDKKSTRESLIKVKPDIVYHLAAYGAYSYQDEMAKIMNTNIYGTLNLLDACKLIDLELFVNTGSSSEYGFKQKSMKETDVLEPNSFYAISKSTQTNICNYYAKQSSMPIVTLRPFSVYGPYEEPGRLVPNMMRAFYNKSELKMVSKSIVRDFIYIDDFVDVCLKVNALKKHSGEIFNIGTGVQTNFGELIQIFQIVSGERGIVSWNVQQSKKWDSNFWKADTLKTSSLLNFKPKYSLEAGLKQNWKWFQSNHKLYG